MDQLLSKEPLISKSGAVNPAELGKVRYVAFYVAANWISGTREFTQKLIEFYNLVNAQGKIFEIIYVSEDRDGDTMQEHFDMMPWLTIAFGSQQGIVIKKAFNVRLTPALVVCEPDGRSITLNGKVDVETKRKDAILHWGKIQAGKIRRTKAGKEYEIFRLVVQPR